MSKKIFSPEEIMGIVAKGRPFTLLLLLKGTPVPDDEVRVNQMQLEHLAHLFSMEHEGKASVFGPVSNDDQLYGIIIFNTTDKEAIRGWMAEDPYIKAGHLTYALYDWFTIPGQKIQE